LLGVVAATLGLDPHLATERQCMDLLAGTLTDLQARGQLRHRGVRLRHDVIDAERKIDHGPTSRVTARLRVATVAKKSSMTARASCPPSKPRQTLRSRPANS